MGDLDDLAAAADQARRKNITPVRRVVGPVSVQYAQSAKKEKSTVVTAMKWGAGIYLGIVLAGLSLLVLFVIVLFIVGAIASHGQQQPGRSGATPVKRSPAHQRWDQEIGGN